MIKQRLAKLEAAVVERNPLLAQRLRPPLSDSQIRTVLKRAKIEGSTEPAVALYSWKNGTVFDEVLRLSKTGFFPGEHYQFIDLEKAIEHMRGYRECVCNCFPKLAGLGRRYLPLFWNGATNWMGLDLDSSENRVVLIRFFIKEASYKDGHYEAEIYEKDPPHEAYGSFGEFLEDAIQANVNNEQLACFRQTSESASNSGLVQSELSGDAIAKKAGANQHEEDSCN